MKQQEPSVGRIVRYIPQGDAPVAYYAALIVHVWSAQMVNLVIWDSNGVTSARTSVSLGAGAGCWHWPVFA